MKYLHLYISISVFFLMMPAFGEEYDRRRSDLTSDSVAVSSLLDSVKSDYVKEQIEQLLNKISLSRRIFSEYQVEVYERNRNDYRKKERIGVTISELLDSISDVMEKSEILRVHNMQLGGESFEFYESTFKDLNKESEYREKIRIMEIIERAALNPNRKSSLEWIWGKSYDNDAYFSTKLTYFDDRFSLYPEYRFYIGYDPLRSSSSWFFNLKDHPPERDGEMLEEYYTSKTPDFVSGENEEVIEYFEEFDCGGKDITGTGFTTETFIYRTSEDGYVLDKTVSMHIDELLDAAYSTVSEVKFIRLSGTDFIFSGNEMSRNEKETFVEITGDINLCSVRISSFLSEAAKSLNKKRSVELITGINSDRMSYNAGVITVYDGQTSFFPDLRIFAPSETRNDRTSWFHKF